MTKKERIQKILDIIENNEIDTQEELTQKLVDFGFDVSQATVSRDINEMGLIKVNGVSKKFKYAKPLNFTEEIPEKIINLFNQVCVSIDCVNNLIVIKTISGNAGTAGMCIDEMKINNVLGSIAGDDTLLVITKSDKFAEDIVKNLQQL